MFVCICAVSYLMQTMKSRSREYGGRLIHENALLALQAPDHTTKRMRAIRDYRQRGGWLAGFGLLIYCITDVTE